MVTKKEMAELEQYLKEKDKENNHEYPIEMLRKFVGVYEQNQELESKVSYLESVKASAVFLSNYREIMCFAEEILNGVDNGWTTPFDIQDCIMLVGNAIDDGIKICSDGALDSQRLTEVENAVMELKSNVLVELERSYDESQNVYDDRDIELEF